MAGWSVPGVVHLRQEHEDSVGRRVIARHRITRKPFAITYLSPEFLGDAEFRMRFKSECVRLARIRQAGLARTFRYVECDDGAAVISERINGTSLRSLLLAQGAVHTEAALVVLKDLLLALAACHQAGLAHGDVKPDAVMLTSNGRVALMDFGLWTAGGRQRLARSTPFYLAPEQWGGPAVSRPSGDVYAATTTFFECLAGAPPFYAGNASELSSKHRESVPPVEVIPEAVRELVSGGLAKDARFRPDAQSLLAVVADAAVRAVGSGWEQRGRRALAAHLTNRSPLADLGSPDGRVAGAGRVAYRRPVRLAAVVGGALALAAGLSSPPLAVIPGIDIFGSGGRPPVLAFPEPDRGPVAMRVVTNGRPADRTPAATVNLRPVAGGRSPASSVPVGDLHAVPDQPAHPDALHQGAARPEGDISGQPTSDQSTRACIGQPGDGANPCTARHPAQPAPDPAGSPSDRTQVSIPVALPIVLPPTGLPVRLPLQDQQPVSVRVPVPVQLPAPVQLPVPVPQSVPIPDRIESDQDFQAAKSFPAQIDSRIPRKMTVRAARPEAGSNLFGQPKTLSQKEPRGFSAGRMGNR